MNAEQPGDTPSSVKEIRNRLESRLKSPLLPSDCSPSTYFAKTASCDQKDSHSKMVTQKGKYIYVAFIYKYMYICVV